MFAPILFLLAQIINVPEDYPTPCEATLAAPAGATVVVHGGTWESLCIYKPMTVIGDPPALFVGTQENGGYSSAIYIGNNSFLPFAGTVTLKGIRTGGVAGGTEYPMSQPALVASGIPAAIVRLEDCEIKTAESTYTTGISERAILTDAGLMVLERCTVRASDSERTWLDGAYAILSTGPVVLIDCQVQGGDALKGRYEAHDPRAGGGAAGAPAELGAGGGAVEAPAVYSSNSELKRGSTEGPRELEIVRADRFRELDARLSVSGGRIGESVVLDVAIDGWFYAMASGGYALPIPIRGVGEVFLSPDLIWDGFLLGPRTLEFPLPSSMSIVGRLVVFQAADVQHPAMTRPVGVTIVP